RWIKTIVQDIQSSTIARISLVILTNAETTSPEVGTSSFRDYRSLLYSVYSRVDDFKTEVNDDALEYKNIEGCVSDCTVLVLKSQEGKVDRLADVDIERILSFDLDVALNFGRRFFKGEEIKIAKHGIWSHHCGDTSYPGLVGLWEVMDGRKVTPLSLRVLTEEGESSNVLCTSISPVSDRFSVRLNRNEFYWKLSALVMRKLKELQVSSNLKFESLPTLNSEPDNSERLPTNGTMFWPLTRLMGNYLASLVRNATTFTQWSLAYKISSNDQSFRNVFDEFNYLIPPKDRFWADPFPVKVDGKYHIFIEECLFAERKGHISVIEMDDLGNWTPPVKVLERDYHLSYTCTFEWQGEHYMIPETLGHHSVELYRCVSFPLKWELDKVLIHDINATDATIIQVNDLWWIFVNVGQRSFPVDWNELYLYYADSPKGIWKPHRRNPVKTDARSSRPAGRLFRQNGELYRPAQNSSGRYGYALSLNRVVELD